MNYVVYRAPEYAGAWVVEQRDYIGDDQPVARFYGHEAELRAIEYSLWKQSADDLRNLYHL